MVIYKKKNGEFGLRKKGGISAERMATDPSFEQVRLNARDFAKAGKAAMLIKRAFATMTPRQANSDLFNRLTKACKAVIKSDLSHERGHRNLLEGDTGLLSQFEFNTAGVFSNTVYIPLQHDINRVAGTVSIEVPAFIPRESILAPGNATHCRIRAGVASINFDSSLHTFASAVSADILLDKAPRASETLTASIPPGTADPVFIALAIEFLEMENGTEYPVSNSRFNLMQLAVVDVPV